jgi:hypothetical protein
MKNSMKMLFAGISFSAYLVFTSFVSLAPKKAPVCGSYAVQLVSVQPVGTNFEWVWSVTNPAPGNGSNCTLQNLSHWSLIPNACLTQANIVSAAYSLDGVSWIDLPAVLAVDPSNPCYTGQVLKFDYGTNGSASTYYKLTVSDNYNTGFIGSTFKSGSKTGCHTYGDLVIGPTCGQDR